MFDKISNSWKLIQSSAQVLRADKELILFPILSAIGVLLVTLSFAVPALLAGFFDAVFNEGAEVAGAVVAFLFYLVQYTVIIFFNSALVGAAMIRLRGGDPTVRDGLRIASQRLGTILGYALISATVGMILRWVAQRGRLLGRIIASLVGLAWNLATYLVVPVLVVEDVGPLEAVKRSADLLKRTWGEQIAGNFSIGLVFGLVIVALILLGIPVMIAVFSTESLALIVLAILAFVLVVAVLGILSSALNGIYTAALYTYAMEGETGGFFDPALVEGAFEPQSRGRSFFET
jgi:hypothetical protein